LFQLAWLNDGDVTRQAKYVIRKQKFRELCTEDPLAAVQYLRRDISATVDPTDRVAMHEVQILSFSHFDFNNKTKTAVDCDNFSFQFHNLPNLLFSGWPSQRLGERSSVSSKITNFVYD